MPVYTVHAPVANNMDFRATDRFAFVRDGFHLWAAVLGVIWLAWHRLWLALLGWIVLMAVVDVAMRMVRQRVRAEQLHVPGAARAHVAHGDERLGLCGHGGQPEAVFSHYH